VNFKYHHFPETVDFFFFGLSEMKTGSVLFVLVAVVLCVARGNESVSNQKQSNRDSGQCDGSVSWVLDDDTMTFSGSGSLGECSSINSSIYLRVKSVIINDGITEIEDSAFEDWIELSSVSVPDSLGKIGNNAFRNTSLTSFHIPKSLYSLDGCAFWDCKNLTTFTIDANNSYYIVEDNTVFTSDKTTLVRYAPGQRRTKYIIPDGVTEVGRCAFQHSSHLEDVTIPDTVQTLVAYSFHRMKIRSIIIPGSVSTIGNFAFCYDDGLSYVRYLGQSDPYKNDKEVFCECPNLTDICVESNYSSSQFCQMPVNKTCVDSSFDSDSSSPKPVSLTSPSTAVLNIPSVALTLAVFIILIFF